MTAVLGTAVIVTFALGVTYAVLLTAREKSLLSLLETNDDFIGQFSLGFPATDFRC
jgi:hypothetical protein